MKQYILILSSLGILSTFGLTGFIKVEKSNIKESKKTSYQVNPARQLGLYTRPVSVEFENMPAQQTTKLDKASRKQLLENIAQLPLIFEKNMGQWKSEILYRANTESAQVGFRKNGVSFCTAREVNEDGFDHGDGEDNEDDEQGGDLMERMVWNLNFKGMNTTTQIVAEGEVAGVTSYLLGNDSTKWVRNSPESRMINYKGIYDNIDLHYYGLENHKLEYDYIVKPGGDIAKIKMQLDGAEVVKINEKGELIIKNPWGKIAEDKPVCYQVIDGVRKEADIRYNIIDSKTFGFKAYGDYDKNYDLVIDPKTLIWDTYLNGTASLHYVQDICIDANMNSYITGWTEDNFDTKAGAYQGTFGGTEDGYVTKFNRWGTVKVYSTYLGGSSQERLFGIGVGSTGEAVITGYSNSSDYPMLNAFDGTFGGSRDAVITKLNAAGSGLTYSTYVGGGSSDQGYAIFVNAAGEAWATGMGKSAAAPNNFPTTAGVIRTNGASNGSEDVFVIKLTAAGANSICTLYGGNSNERGYGIFVDASNIIYITGQTASSVNFATTNGLYTTLNGTTDAFVAKINNTATILTYSTYLGGSAADGGHAIYARNGEAYVSGETTSTDFPTTGGAFQTANAGGVDVFVTKFNSAGSALSYSTYLGSSIDEGELADDKRSDIVVNANGEAYVTAITTTGGTNYPMTSTYGGFDLSYNLEDDGVFSLLNATGTAQLCATYWGGEKDEYTRFAIDIHAGAAGSQDTLYTSITVHSASSFSASPGLYPIAETQGTVYSKIKVNSTGQDEPGVVKWASCITTLPVELIYFRASNKGNNNLLEWATAQEINNDYFNIERSIDGVNFVTIGTVDGAGNSNNKLNYSYADQKGDAITYYRLKQTDIDGKTSYSKIVIINAPDASKSIELTVSSPVTDYLNYKVCCLTEGDVKVEVIDMSGQLVLSTNIQINEGGNNLTLDTKNLASGAYTLKITGNNFTVSNKFIK